MRVTFRRILAAATISITIWSADGPLAAAQQRREDNRPQEDGKDQKSQKNKERDKPGPNTPVPPQKAAPAQPQAQGRPRQKERLPQQQQQERISQQQQRSVQYGQYLDQQERLALQRSAQLQQQRRMNQYQFQQQYIARLRQQQIAMRNAKSYNYGGDPYFYTASSYRYYRGDRYYETNQYGANLLRQAVNYGYDEGYRAGQADRRDHWKSGFEDTYAYQDGSYGYTGYYIDRDDYSFYFREGFRRGYEDGYNARYQYGHYAAGSYSILDPVLSIILKFEILK